MNAKSIITTTIHNNKYQDLWEKYFLPIGLPLLVGLGLGPLLAFFIVSGYLSLAYVIVLLVPMAILLNRYPLVAVMIWMVVLLFVPFTRKYSLVYWLLHRTLMPMALGISMISRMLRLKKYQPVRLGRAELAMFAFGTTTVLSILLTGSSIKSILTLYDRTLVAFTVYLLMRFLSPREQDLKRLISLMSLLCLTECVIGLLSWFAPQVLPSIWHSREGILGNRVTGTFNQPEPYVSVLIFFMVFLFHNAMNRERGLIRTILILTFGLGMVCIFFSFTRGCWLAGLLVLLGLLFLYPKPTFSLTLVVVSIMVILSAGVLAREFAHAYERLRTEETAQSRIVLVNAGKKMFYARPVFGWGYENYSRYSWKFIERVGNVAPSEWDLHESSHNTYLTILAEMGVVGFFFYIFPILWWLRLTIKALPRLPQEGFWSWRLLVIMWLSLGAHFVVSQSVDMRWFLFPHTTMWLTLGLIANMVQGYLEPDDIGAPKWAVRLTS